MSARNMAKRTAAGTLALAVCLGGGAIALASAASADANFKFDQRVQGDDRYGTAIAASKLAFPDGTKTDNVVLVNGYATVDGLTASYLAGVANAPILYVSDKGADDATKAEIKRLGAKNIWLVGGTKVIPQSVEDAIKGDGYTVNRINGSDRYETAKLIAEAGAKITGKQPSKVFVASGTSFADALAVSPIAYAKGYAIALTEKDSTSDFTKKELGNIGTDNKILVGGTAVVSDKVAADLSIKSDARVAGDDRAATANYIADWANKSEGFNPANAALVGGTNGNGADSLVAASLLGKSFTTLHFAGWDATQVWMKDHAAQLTGKGFVFGGKAAVSDGQVTAAQSAAQNAAASNQTYTVSGGGAVATVSANSNNKGVVQYTVSGLGKDKVDIVLADPTNVTVNANGAVTFAADASGKLAKFGTASAAGYITVVNGVGNGATNPTAYGITPNNGSITFTVDSAVSGAAIPVVFTTTDGNDTLAIDSKGNPTEAFGIGGKITWLPTEAAAGTFGSSGSQLTVKSVDLKAGYFVAGAAGSSSSDNVYKIKSGDTTNYLVSGSPVNTTWDKFSAMISAGDTIYGTYSTSGASVLNLNDIAPVAPATLVASQPTTASDTSITLTVADSATKSVASYNIYRAPGSSSSIANPSGAIPSNWVKVGNVADSAPGTANGSTVKFTDTGLKAATHYNYAVTAVDASGQEGSTVTYSGDQATTATPIAMTPQSTSAAYNDANVDKYLNKGDSLTVGFSGAVSVSSTYALTLVDPSGNTVKIDNTNSSATASSDGTTVVFSLSSDPKAVSGNAPLGYLASGGAAQALEVLSASGISNATGAWNLPGSTVRAFSSSTLATAPLANTVAYVANGSKITASSLSAGNVVRVYNAQGVLLGKATASGSSLDVPLSPSYSGDDLLYITKQTTDGAAETAARPLGAGVFSSVALANAGSNSGLGVGDTITITYNGPVNATSIDPSLTAGNSKNGVALSSIFAANAAGVFDTNTTGTGTANVSLDSSGKVLTVTIATVGGASLAGPNFSPNTSGIAGANNAGVVDQHVVVITGSF